MGEAAVVDAVGVVVAGVLGEVSFEAGEADVEVAGKRLVSSIPRGWTRGA